MISAKTPATVDSVVDVDVLSVLISSRINTAPKATNRTVNRAGSRVLAMAKKTKTTSQLISKDAMVC